ncbi:MAG: hypothetical protein FJ147_24440 [Deltaproteobacteria bacterium]|nr:hypothetical protein [Deltaproteobacteria bacterium]
MLTGLCLHSLSIIAPAVTVNPTGVNTRINGPTVAFLTFIGLNDQRPMEGTWCGAINPDGSCVAGTIFGVLPPRSDFSTASGGRNFTDIMTIPPSVARRAYQDALRGNASEFFYVRRFQSLSGGPDEFVPVTCRMAGGGARSPLALTEVQLRFNNNDAPILAVNQGQPLQPFRAEIHYNGSGRLKGRWEVVVPGDPLPEERDLLTEGTLPLEERGLQRRYTLIDRFDTFLAPTGKITLPGPSPDRLPRATDGLHLILLRVEATDDKEAGSVFGPGQVDSGGVAGFPLPVLRYYVGANPQGLHLATRTAGGIQLLSPQDKATLPAAQKLTFRWAEETRTHLYQLEITKEEKPLFSAVINQGTTEYTAPSWIKEHAGTPLQWRVQALGTDGASLLQSEWRTLQLQP